MLVVAIPAALAVALVELQHGRASPWLWVTALAAVMGALALADKSKLARRAAPFVVCLVVFAAAAFLHFGSQIGSGLLIAVATMSATFFLGRTGAVAALLILPGTVALGVFGQARGLIPPGTVVVADPTIGARMLVATTIAVATLALVLLRIQQALKTAHAREIGARAEQQIAERERERALEAALQSQRLEATGRLASGVAHDFNNALMVLQGTIELLGMPTSDEARAQLVDEGLAAIEGASATARQLLDLSRPGGEIHGRCQPGPLLERFSRSVRRVLPSSLRLDVEIGPCPEVPLAAATLEQILLNLVINARDATGGRGTVHLSCGRDGDDAFVEVRDMGSGMSEETQRRLFEPFFSTKDADHGTGLGLSMVHGLVTHSGGTITVQSELGRGSTFVLRWPTPAREPAAAVGQRVPKPPPAADEAPTILVVEPNPDVARVMARTLTAAGFTVTTVHAARDAREQLERRRFALVCTDAVLPDGTALDLIEVRRASGGDGPLLVCTGYLERPELAVALQQGGRLLRKPFALAHLVDHAREAIEATSSPAPIDPPARRG